MHRLLKSRRSAPRPVVVVKAVVTQVVPRPVRTPVVHWAERRQPDPPQPA